MATPNPVPSAPAVLTTTPASDDPGMVVRVVGGGGGGTVDQGAAGVDPWLVTDAAAEASLASIDAKLTNPLPVSGTITVSNFPLGQETEAASIPVVQASDTPSKDTAEFEYSPGFKGQTVTASGDTTIHQPTDPTKAFRVRWIYAVPVVRTLEEPPVVTIKITTSADVLVASFPVAAVSKRTLITAPVNGKLKINLDIAARVPSSALIEEF